MLDGEAFGAEIVEIVKAYVERQLAAAVVPLQTKINELLARAPDLSADQLAEVIAAVVSAMPPPVDGKEVDLDLVREMIADEVGRLPPPEPGKPGESPDPATIQKLVDDAVSAIPKAEDGKNADMDAVRAMVEDAVSRMPAPKDGTSVSIDDVRPLIEAEVERAAKAMPVPKEAIGVAGAIIDRNGELVLTLSDGSSRALGAVVGRDADMGALSRQIADGIDAIPRPRDGFGFDDLTVEHDGERKFSLRFVRGDAVKDFPFSLPVVIDRGIFRDGASYERGDAVTWAGSLWIAQRSAETKPGDGEDWRLAVKRGRDGKSLARA